MSTHTHSSTSTWKHTQKAAPGAKVAPDAGGAEPAPSGSDPARGSCQRRLTAPLE